MELHSCRSYGFGMGPIPWTAIRDYATAWDFDEEQTIELFRLIRSMDNELLALNDKKRKHKEQREQSSSRKGGGNARHRNI